MIVPDEFSDLCARFHQDVALDHTTPDEMIASAIRWMNGEQRQVVQRFLDDLLDGQHAPGEAKRVWRNSPAEIHFTRSRDARAFLEMIRRALRG